MSKAGRGLIAAAHQHDAVDGLRAQQLLRLHGQEVPVHHGGRLGHLLADGHGGHFHRVAASLPHAALHFFGPLAHVAVAGIAVGPGIDNADDRLAREILAADTHFHGAAAVAEGAHSIHAEPAMAAKVFRLFLGHGSGYPAAGFNIAG